MTLTPLATIKSQNASKLSSFPYFPVAVFIGGTSGIGRATAESFARYTNGNAHIILIGRNRAAAESIIASFPRPTPHPNLRPHPGLAETDSIANINIKHEFIHCDVTLLRNIQNTTQEILSRYSKINYLVISTGAMELFNREITEEGLDRTMMLFYYSRWKFIYELVPALEKARENDEEAKVLSVASAGLGGKIDSEDLELKKASVGTFLRSISTFNDLMVEKFALEHSSITFIHSNPGRVRTPLGSNSSSWIFRAISFLINTPFSPLYYFSLSAEDAGEYQLYGMLVTASTSKRAWRITQDGRDLDSGETRYVGDYPENASARETLWRYTSEVMKLYVE